MSGDGSDSGLIPWVLAGVGAIMSTLLTGVVALFRMRENENAKAIAELKESHAVVTAKADKCEEDRSKLFARCEVLEVKLKHVEDKLAKIDLEGTQFSHRKQA